MTRSVLLSSLALAILLAQPDPFEGAKAGDQREISQVKFCWAPAGKFRMGSPQTEPERTFDEGPVSVTISQGFWIGKFEVTQSEWKRIVGDLPRVQDKGAGDEFPVHWVNYPEAEGFCRRLTERAWASGDLPRNWEIRIPTEAQWEYAARAGTVTATSFGDRLTPKLANFDESRRGEATKAGSYPANPWGLHDMHGNVWEWCRDWYHMRLPGGIDPDLSTRQGAMNRDGSYSRVRRSGAWIESNKDSRAARRLRYEPERRSDHIGFRVIAERK